MATLLWTTWGLAQAEESPPEARSLLLGGPVHLEKQPAIIDPLLPRGEIRPRAALPATAAQLCSLNRPVCVAGEQSARLAAALPHLERAYELIHFGAGRPLRATRLDPLWWVLTPGEVSVHVDTRLGPGLDEGAGHCSGGRPTERDAHLCVHQLSVAQRVPGAASWLRRGFARQQTQQLAYDPEAVALVRAAQEHPGLGIGSPLGAIQRQDLGLLSTRRLEERSSLWFSYLESRAAASKAVDVGFYALTLAATTTRPGALRFEGEPDLFDVVRATVRNDRRDLARFFDAFARARLVGLSDASLLTTGGALPDVAVDWTIDGTSLPRSLALPHPMLPTGSVYLEITRPKNGWPAQVGFRVYCEQPVSYVWSVARLTPERRLISYVPVAFKERGSEAHQRVGELERTARLVLIGTNVGGVDLGHPFDPDHGPHEEHRCMVAVDPLPTPDPDEPAGEP